MYSLYLLLLLPCLTIAETVYEGESCSKINLPGYCVSVHDCSSAQVDLKNGSPPQGCGFNGSTPLVCCPEYLPKETQQKVDPPIIEGLQDAETGEFPHMVALGYGSQDDAVKWKCFGALIGDKYVLTVAHCITITPQEDSTLNFVAAINPDGSPPQEMHKIARTVLHPEFKKSVKYKDIAIIKLVTPIKNLMPVCLPTQNYNESDTATLVDKYLTRGTSHMNPKLLKLPLSKWSNEECEENYSSLLNRRFQGVDFASQLCYGVRAKNKNCDGFFLSGGSLLEKSFSSECKWTKWTITGLASFGHRCGNVGFPDVFTRVSHYVPWIQSVLNERA